MKKILLALIGLILVAGIGAGGYLLLNGDGSSPLDTAADQVKVSAANAILDSTGARDQVQSLIDQNIGTVVAVTGMSAEEVQAAVDQLDIASWQATSLPSDAVATSTIDGSELGYAGSVTLYEDPGYVTVSAFGQNMTLSVPESAQASFATIQANLASLQ